MLNEISEANCYMTETLAKGNGSSRIKSNTLFKKNSKDRIAQNGEVFSMNGLERLLMMVARRVIFSEPGAGDAEITQEQIRKAKAALCMWCGVMLRKKQSQGVRFQPEDYAVIKEKYLWINEWIPEEIYHALNNEYPGINGWLPYYIENLTDEETLEKIIPGIEELISEKKQEALRKPAFSRSPYKQLCYEKVIANAIARGPLKEYCLVCTNGSWNEGIKKQRGKNPEGKPMRSDEDRILKLLAAYMLERERKYIQREEVGFEPVNFVDISFWAEKNSYWGKKNYEVFSYNGEALFAFEKTPTGNLTKAKPCRRWYEKCDWRLLDITNDEKAMDKYSKEHPSAIFFLDDGENAPLRIRER